MDGENLRLDGNCLGGLLAEIFRFDMSNAETVCGGCEMVRPVGALLVYRHEMGAVVRCAGCDHVLMQIAALPGKYRLNLSGMSWFEVNTEVH